MRLLTLTFFSLLLYVIPCSAQAPKSFVSRDRDCPAPRAFKMNEPAAIILELHDHKMPNRRLIVRANGDYEFRKEIGAITVRGNAVFSKASECQIRFVDDEQSPISFSIAVDADLCQQTGRASASGVFAGQAFSFELFDKTKSAPSK